MIPDWGHPEIPKSKFYGSTFDERQTFLSAASECPEIEPDVEATYQDRSFRRSWILRVANDSDNPRSCQVDAVTAPRTVII